jgi:hypothetical protein
MRRAYALPIVLAVLGLLTVAIGALALAVRGSIDNARMLAAQARAEAQGRGLLTAVEVALAEAVAAGRTSIVTPGSSNGAWDLVRAEGGNSCRPVTGPTPAQLLVAPTLAGITEAGCFADWVAPDLFVDEVRISPLGLPRGSAPRGSGFFPEIPVTSSGALLSMTVRDDRKSTRATSKVALQILSASPFSFQGWSALPARLPSTGWSSAPPVFPGVFHVDGDVCLGAAALSHLTSSGQVGCPGDTATIAGTAVASDPLSWPVAHDRRLLDSRHGVGALRGPFSTMSEVLAPPAATESSAARRARWAMQAGVRIVDGVWYRRPSVGSAVWPGTLLWSDHPGDVQTAGEEAALLGGSVLNIGHNAVSNLQAKLYSRYDPTGSGGIDAGRDGVVWYGATTRDGGIHVPATVAAGAVVPATSDRQLVEGSRLLIVDGTTGRREFPLNIDVAALGRALSSSSSNELGSTGAWNGVLWISSSWVDRTTGTALPEATFTTDSRQPPADAGGRQALPDALCSQSLPDNTFIDTFVVPVCSSGGPRPTVVRLVNGADLQAFGTQGLAIVTDLPLIVVGDWNTATASGTSIPSVLAADRIVQVGNDFTDADALAVSGATGLLTRTTTVRLRAHLFTGVVPDAGKASFTDVVGTVESSVKLEHEGTRAIGFAPRWSTTVLGSAQRPQATSWDPGTTPVPAALGLGIVVDLSSTRLP